MLVTFPEGNAASAPAKEPLLTSIRQKMAQAPNAVSVTPPVFGQDYRSALLSAVLSVDPEDMGSRETVDWMREQLPPVRERQVDQELRSVVKVLGQHLYRVLFAPGEPGLHETLLHVSAAQAVLHTDVRA